MARDFKNGIIVPDNSLDAQALDISGLSTLGDGDVDTAADHVLIYDASGTAIKKVLVDNLGVGGGGAPALPVFSTLFDSLDRHTTSGTVSLSTPGGLTLSNGSSSTGYGRVQVGFNGGYSSGLSELLGACHVASITSLSTDHEGWFGFTDQNGTVGITGSGVSYSGARGAGFRVIHDGTSEKLYAVTIDSGTATETLIGSISGALILQVHHDGTDVLFYVNGVLEATHTTNVPALFRCNQWYCGISGNGNGSYASAKVLGVAISFTP